MQIIQLYNRQIAYSPSLIKLVVYSANSVLEIGNALKIIPRLCQTFKMKYDFLPYSYSIVTDQACDHLQAALNESTSIIQCIIIINIIVIKWIHTQLKRRKTWILIFIYHTTHGGKLILSCFGHRIKYNYTLLILNFTTCYLLS